MLTYNRRDIEDLQEYKERFYMPNPLFNTMQYKLVRLEVKFGYTACLNALIRNASYDDNGYAYILDNDPLIIDILKELANKAVDQEKIDGYLNEMEEASIAERKENKVYLKKVVNIF